MSAAPAANAANLIVFFGDLEAELAKLDAIDAAHRDAALGAVETLIVDYILPAADCPFSDDRFSLFDLEAVAGTEIPGLVLSVFQQQMPGLQKPIDERLEQTLDFLGIATTDSAQRLKFWRCWAANNANNTISGLLNFLDAPFLSRSKTVSAPLTEEAFALEINRLDQLLQHKLPGDVRYKLLSTANFLREKANK